MQCNQDEVQLVEGLLLFLKLIGNVIKNPNEQKFRVISKDNAKIKATLFALHGDIDELVQSAGYTSHEKGYCYNAQDTQLLQRVLALTEPQTKELKLLASMSP